MAGRRLSGRAIALLVAYVLLVHGVVIAVAQGAMAAPGNGLPFVICAPSGAATLPYDGSDKAPARSGSHDCCAVRCQMLFAASACLPENVLATAFAPHGVLVAAPPSRAGPPRSRPARLLAEPRAPPRLSA